MPVEQFLKMNRGIDQGADLPEPFLRVRPLRRKRTGKKGAPSPKVCPRITFGPLFTLLALFQTLYEGIRDTEFAIPDEEKGKLEIFVDSEFKGWLRKEGTLGYLPAAGLRAIQSNSQTPQRHSLLSNVQADGKSRGTAAGSSSATAASTTLSRPTTRRPKVCCMARPRSSAFLTAADTFLPPFTGTIPLENLEVVEIFEPKKPVCPACCAGGQAVAPPSYIARSPQSSPLPSFCLKCARRRASRTASRRPRSSRANLCKVRRRWVAFDFCLLGIPPLTLLCALPPPTWPGHHNSYRLQAASEEDMKKWVHAIRAAMTKDPIFMQLFQRRKERLAES